MSNLSLLRGMLAFIDNTDGQGARTYAAAILLDPRAAAYFPPVVDVDLLAKVLEAQAPALRLIAENDPDALGERLFKTLGVRR